jgi:ELWxxDGT repeat protein
VKRFAFILLLLPHLAAAQAYLVKDLRVSPLPLGSGPGNMTQVGSTIYFTAYTSEYGLELWKTDGSAAGTVLVADLRFGRLSSYPIVLRAFGSSLVFLATDDDGFSLWITRGTAATTTKLARAGTYSIAILNGTIYFAGYDPLHGYDVWVSDGTPAGTHPIVDLPPDTSSRGVPFLFTPFGNRVAFAYSNALWITDGTAAGTRRVRDVVIDDMTAAGGRLFFHGRATNFSAGQLWVSDGTEAGTRELVLRIGSDPFTASVTPLLVPLGDRVVFYADDGVHEGVWISDGATATLLAGGFTHDTRNSDWFRMVARNGVVYMTLRDPAHGKELWRTDGTAAGTWLVIDLQPGKSDGIDDLGVLGVLGDELWFTGAGYRGLWRSDGTAAGTVRVMSGFAYLPTAALNGRAFFSAWDPEHAQELWSTDGTESGTSMLVNLQPETDDSSNPTFLAATAERLFFRIGYPIYAIFATDGTAEGTRRIAASDDVRSLVAYHGAIYYLTTANELWRSDGTAEGTTFVMRFPPGNWLFVAGDVLYVTALYEGSTLWRSDGTAAGTVRLGETNQTFFFLRDFAGQLLVGFDTGTDGTRVPHRLFNAPVTQDLRTAWWVGGGTIYMVRIDPRQTAIHFYMSHGTNFDTSEIVTLTGPKFFVPTESDILPQPLTTAIATTTQLFFALDDGAHGWELWRTDGTAGGTYLVKDIRPGSGSSSPDNFAVFDDKLLFTADDGVFGRELWISDGTAAGTNMVKDIAPLGASSMLRTDVYATPRIIVANGIAWFMAHDGVHGFELWRSDGTAAGTFLAADIEPGPRSSWPEPMAVAGGRLYAAATTLANGKELWALPEPRTAISIADTNAPESSQLARVTVSLSAPSTDVVTARWTADNDRSGILAFAPGQTRAELAVPFDADGIAAGNRVLYVRLHDVRGAIVAKSVAAVLIIDSEIRADVAVTLSLENGQPTAIVTNLGPSDSLEVRLQSQADQFVQRFNLGTLKAGASKKVPVGGSSRPVAARVSVGGSEPDPDPSNNSATLQQAVTAGRLGIAVSPAWLSPGARGTLFVTGNPGAVVRLTSSDPSVVAVPASVTAPASVEIVALSAGLTTITAADGALTAALPLSVVVAGQPVRWPAHMTFTVGLSSLYYGSPRILTAAVPAPAFDTGDVATGIVTFSTGGRVLATAPLDAKGVARAVVDTLLPGDYELLATYSGDGHFFPDSASSFTNVINGPPDVAAIVTTMPASSALTIIVKGFGGIVPTSSVTVSQGDRTLFENAALDAAGSVTRAVVLDPPSGSVKVKYSGDSLYQPVTKTVPLVQGRRHAAH